MYSFGKVKVRFGQLSEEPFILPTNPAGHNTDLEEGPLLPNDKK